MEPRRGYFRKENWWAGTEGRRNGEEAKTADVYCVITLMSQFFPCTQQRFSEKQNV